MMMKITRSAVLALLVVSLTSFTPATLRAQDKVAEEADGWVEMFDGKSLTGWKVNENPESWKVEEGMLVCAGPRAHLFYVGQDKPFTNFHFKADVKTTKGSNAGIYFATKFQESGWPKFGYECQVNVSHTDPKKSSSLYSVENIADPGVKDDEWYTQEIIVEGRRIRLLLNGETMVDYTEPENQPAYSKDFDRRLMPGTFALQAHDPMSVVYFKNLEVKRLP
ncbi:3-keto-disaccharide hydrolase [Aureliella helgolandensis]|uniref:3-keto-alpha-glucoside-1,2-lyase/3-keto-2-hydroxy-glucal hydratase domain-containing protein n=1 Tax=Aureliella helgolandensis TaxID=2527968 RepID=A0A518GH17_9BACT|nr:DUF1080 domain-containing protein [Aureliella helgolandensis]QDV27891.1 hypothetical protein Q31a_62840 [Aureliella helgolandensis]